MPRFFFDIIDGSSVTDDHVGVELSDRNVARIEATRTLSEIAAQELPGNGPQKTLQIAVRDHQRIVLFTVQLAFDTIEGPGSVRNVAADK